MGHVDDDIFRFDTGGFTGQLPGADSKFRVQGSDIAGDEQGAFLVGNHLDGSGSYGVTHGLGRSCGGVAVKLGTERGRDVGFTGTALKHGYS